MRRRVIKVEVVLLDVLAMVAFMRRQPEEAFLEDRVFAIPEGRRKYEDLVAIAEAGDAILAPAIRFAACQPVRQILPDVTVRAVIFADGSPGPVADVRTP